MRISIPVLLRSISSRSSARRHAQRDRVALHPHQFEGRDEPRTSFPDEVQDLFPGAFQFPFALGVDRRDLRFGRFLFGRLLVRIAARRASSSEREVPRSAASARAGARVWTLPGRAARRERSRGGCGLRRRFRPGCGRLRSRGGESARTPVVRPARVEPLRVAAEPPERDSDRAGRRVGLRLRRSRRRRPRPPFGGVSSGSGYSPEDVRVSFFF